MRSSGRSQDKILFPGLGELACPSWPVRAGLLLCLVLSGVAGQQRELPEKQETIKRDRSVTRATRTQCKPRAFERGVLGQSISD